MKRERILKAIDKLNKTANTSFIYVSALDWKGVIELMI